ncbi:MAG: ArsR family transcriptional regulator [Leptospirales bacterium]|nr:ArsR family transcriptional regulator [Leptospirales bacterium]
MNNKEFKGLIYGRLAQVAKCLSDAGRLEILDMVTQAPKPVEQLVAETKMTLGTVSHHLQLLKRAGLVTSRKDGRYVVYSHTTLGRDLFTQLCAAGETHLAEIRMAMLDFFGHDDLEALDERELIKKARDREIMLIDVRPENEYEAGHIPGAVSVPIKELEKRLKSLPRTKDIFAYCRGRYCVLSTEATKTLRKNGYRVLRLPRGPMDFQAKGITLSVGKQ